MARKRIRQRLPRREPGSVRQYRPGATLTREQAANLRFRGDWFAIRDGRLTVVFGSEDERRAAWTEHGHRFAYSTVPGTRPAAYWQYTPDVPEELRTLRGWWDARWAKRQDLAPYLSCPEAVVASEALGAARRHWLLEHGASRPGEREVLTRESRRPHNDDCAEAVARLRRALGG
jgi:hypothetical protein